MQIKINTKVHSSMAKNMEKVSTTTTPVVNTKVNGSMIKNMATV
jgi:hypothetical protein